MENQDIEYAKLLPLLLEQMKDNKTEITQHEIKISSLGEQMKVNTSVINTVNAVLISLGTKMDTLLEQVNKLTNQDGQTEVRVKSLEDFRVSVNKWIYGMVIALIGAGYFIAHNGGIIK